MRKLATAAALAALLLIPSAAANHTPAPASVTIAGDLQTQVGCANNWDPGCAATHLTYDANDDVWQGTFSVPAGDWNYKAALNDSWNENYGANAGPGGANIGLHLGSQTSVKFYYDHKSHWITDNVNSVIATVAGSFQSELGCGPNPPLTDTGDWDPSCLRSWLQDPDGDGVYTFESTAIPAGHYEAKVALNESWDVNYGQGGVQNGPNIGFTVPFDGAKVVFRYDPTSHVLTIQSGHAHDGNVEWDGLRFDSRDSLYRTPAGAVPAGTPVLLRFRTFHDDVTGVKVRVWDAGAGAQRFVTMTRAASGVSCYEASLAGESCDLWQATLASATPDVLWYRFAVSDGSTTAYYADDTSALDGGPGATTSDVRDWSYSLTFYRPGFTVPKWARHATIYQIFPDRFRNGDTKNDPKTGDVRYDDPALELAWGTKPEGYCRNYDTPCPWRFDANPPVWSPDREAPRGRDYYGGDLKGIRQKLAYIRQAGFDTIYLNPIFWAKSNHRYDTADYLKVDPYLGDENDFKDLVQEAHKQKFHIILDGVFNHMSSDSPFFDRYHHYGTTGACESLSSPYRGWFDFTSQNVPCSSSDYVGWFGFDTIPQLHKANPDVQSYFLTGKDSVTRHWLKAGADGWRLDVMGDPSFPAGYWSTFRQVVKQTDPNALIVGELWQKDSTLLGLLDGDAADTTMNYRLRDVVNGLFSPNAWDPKGFPDSGHSLTPTQASERLLAQQEDYAPDTYASLMNLIDSHDTARALWVMTPGADDTAAKEQNAVALAEGKQRLQLAALVQYTIPGAPTVYYGDEVGVTGNDDPDNRRTYPWADTGGSPDSALLSYYTRLGQLRSSLDPLESGDFRVLLADDAAGVLAYGRRSDKQAALIVLNRSGSPRTISVAVAGYLPDGTALAPALGGGAATSVSGGAVPVTVPALAGVVLATEHVDLKPPTAPTGLAATSSSGTVALTWTAVPDATAYNVYRSPVTGGGYVRVNASPVTGGSFTDSGLPNGAKQYYVVRALDKWGNESADSNEVAATPHLSIGWANLQWPPTLNHTISAVNRTDSVYGQVWIDGVTSQPGQTPTLRAQLGWGPHGSNPDGNAAWQWQEASFNTDVGNNDEFVATLLPDRVGAFDYAYRYTTTDGESWVYADLDGIGNGYDPAQAGQLTVNPSGDSTAPATPTGLHVVAADPGSITLGWDAVAGDPSEYGYEVARSSSSGGPFTTLGLVTDTSYVDTTVDQDATYYYVVRAVDTSFNRSGDTAPVQAKAALREVTVTFNVTVPASTDGTGRAVHIAGTLSALDPPGPDWDPTSNALTRVDATHWTITLHGLEATQLQYKYVLGDWNYVEKDGSCGEINNRLLTLSYGAGGTQTVNDTVQNWRNVAPCGN